MMVAAADKEDDYEVGAWLSEECASHRPVLSWDSALWRLVDSAFRRPLLEDRWKETSLPELIRGTLAAATTTPRLEELRFAHVPGVRPFGCGDRGFLWVDCERPVRSAAFVCVTAKGAHLRNVDIFLSNYTTNLMLSPQLLAALHRYLLESGPARAINLGIHGLDRTIQLLPDLCGL